MESNFLHLQSQSPELAVVSTRWSFCDGGRRLPNLESFCNFQFFLNFSSHLHALGLISNDLPGQGVDGQGLPAPLDQAGLVHLPNQPWWSRCWHLSWHRAGWSNFGRSRWTKEVVERVVGRLRQVGCPLQSWLLVSQLKCWGHPALSVKESKIG